MVSNSVCFKSRQILELLFYHFSPHSPPSVLFNLYTMLVRLHLQYCSVLWDPSTHFVTNSLGKLLFFALEVCSKSWSSSFFSLLCQFNCPSLSTIHKISKLVFLFTILYDYVYYPPNTSTQSASPPNQYFNLFTFISSQFLFSLPRSPSIYQGQLFTLEV